jgi:hypothetical protein
MNEAQVKQTLSLSLLIVLLLVTRLARELLGVHLPDAAVSVFFLAGCLGLSSRALVLLMISAAGVDLVQFALGASTACVSPGYPLLFVAYLATWFAGRAVSARGLLVQAGAMIGSGGLAFLLTSGGYYLLSGKFTSPSLGEFAERAQRYLPTYLMNVTLYVVVALAVQLLATAARKRA